MERARRGSLRRPRPRCAQRSDRRKGRGGRWPLRVRASEDGELREDFDLPNLVIRPLAEHPLRFPPLRDQDDPNLQGLVFCGEKGGPVRRHVFRKVWRTACAAAKIEPIRLDWLRHTGASIVYRATGDMKVIANRLGHGSTRMLDTVYLKVYADAAREVADALDRDPTRTSRGLLRPLSKRVSASAASDLRFRW